MLNLKEIAKATGGTLVTAAKKSEDLDDFVSTVVAKALFEKLDKNLLKATKTYKQITFKSFVTPLSVSSEFGDVGFNLVLDLQSNMTFKGKKIKQLFVSCGDGCSILDHDTGMFYRKNVTSKPITSIEQLNQVLAKVLEIVVRDFKPAK